MAYQLGLSRLSPGVRGIQTGPDGNPVVQTTAGAVKANPEADLAETLGVLGRPLSAQQAAEQEAYQNFIGNALKAQRQQRLSSKGQDNSIDPLGLPPEEFRKRAEAMYPDDPAAVKRLMDAYERQRGINAGSQLQSLIGGVGTQGGGSNG